MTRVVLSVQNLGVPDDPRVWQEARTLAAEGYDVTVIAPSADGAPCRERLDDVDIVRYRHITGDGTLAQIAEVVSGCVSTARALRRLRRSGPIDVLHVANPPDTVLPIARRLLRNGTRFVYDQHDAAPELAAVKLGQHPVLDRVLRRLERASCGAADVVITSNNSARSRLIADGLARARVVTVRLGPERADPPAAAPDVPTVVYAGVMGGQDTVDVLIDAFALLHRRRPHAARLLLIGRGGAVPALRRRVAEHGLDEAVTWAGWVPRTEVRTWLRSATVGVSPDVDDRYTRLCTMIKVSEYLAAGLPAVVADLPENRETAGDAALYFRPGDARDLADRVEDVLFDPERRGTLADAAARRAPTLLWEHSAARLLDTYHHLLDGAPAIEGDQRVGDDVVVARGN